MKQILKWTAITGAGLIVIIIAALLLIPMFVDVAKFKPLIEERVSKSTGRPFAVGDDVKLTLFPWAGLTFSDLQLGNPPEFAEKDFLAIKSLEIRLKLLPLVFRDIQVQRFILNEPRIVLIKSRQGRGNWNMGPQEASPKSGPSGIQKSDTFELPVKALAIGDFVIIKGSVTWIDHINGFRKSGTGIDFRLKDVSLDQPFPLDTADPKALNRLSLVARLKADQKSVVVTDGKLRLDDSTVNMKLKILNFDQPDLTFDLTLDKIDADRYLPPKSGDQGPEGRSSAAKLKGSSTRDAPSSAPAANPWTTLYVPLKEVSRMM